MPNDDEFHKALSEYLNPPPTSGTISVPLGICFDQGRVAAIDGILKVANPYYPDKEPDEHRAWFEGFNSVKHGHAL